MSIGSEKKVSELQIIRERRQWKMKALEKKKNIGWKIKVTRINWSVNRKITTPFFGEYQVLGSYLPFSPVRLYKFVFNVTTYLLGLFFKKMWLTKYLLSNLLWYVWSVLYVPFIWISMSLSVCICDREGGGGSVHVCISLLFCSYVFVYNVKDPKVYS